MTEPRRMVRVLEHVEIPLSDGLRLAARIWLPDGAEIDPVPAVLEYIPYRKRGGTEERDETMHPYVAARGYACARVDLRGSGESDGVLADEYLPIEQDDALEVIAWMARQPWCTGKVGIIGKSWGGFNGLQIAARRPSALAAVISVCSTDDRYADDIHFKGGCLLTENQGWGATMLAYSSRPPDPALVGDRWREMWLERLEGMPPLPAVWLRHQTRDAYWTHGSVCEDFAAVEVPVLAVGGWADSYSNAVSRLLTGLGDRAWGVIGPWAHQYPHQATIPPAVDFLDLAVRWWDRWLKGGDSGVEAEPRVRAFVTGAGRWVSAGEWPPAGTAWQRRWLASDGLAAVPSRETAPRSISSPATTGLAAGEFCPMWHGQELPGDQRADDAGSLTFDTRPLPAPLELVGAPVLDLEVEADRPVAFVVARLCDVGPDGESTRISWAVRNLTHDDGHREVAPLEPGRRFRIRIVLDDLAHRVATGHRIRLALSTSYWPLVWPSPEPVRLTIHGGILDLPVAPPGLEDRGTPWGPPTGARPDPVEVLRPPASTRTVRTDPATGETVFEIVDDFGAHRGAHGLATSEVARETYRIGEADPLSARVDTEWVEEMWRDSGWSVRTVTTTSMTADRQLFRITARLEAYEGETLMHARDWDETVERSGV
jgi:hypothetical protein